MSVSILRAENVSIWDLLLQTLMTAERAQCGLGDHVWGNQEDNPKWDFSILLLTSQPQLNSINRERNFAVGLGLSQFVFSWMGLLGESIITVLH